MVDNNPQHSADKKRQPTAASGTPPGEESRELVMEKIYYFPKDIQAHIVFFIIQSGYPAQTVDGGLRTTVPHETLRSFLYEYGLDLDAFVKQEATQ